MKRGSLFVALMGVSLALAGCGGSVEEIKPQTGGAPAQLDPTAAQKAMEESYKNMPPAQQARMKAQMDAMKQRMTQPMPGGAPGGAPEGGSPPAP
jgi:uncharacterized protein YceK